MPRYEVTAPDGTKYQVDAPEGATEQQAIEYIASQWKPSEPAAQVPPNAIKNPGGGYAMPSLSPPDQGFWGTLATAAGRSIDKLLAGGDQIELGINRVLPINSQIDEDRLDQQQRANDAAYAGIQRNRPLTSAVGEGLGDTMITAPLMGGATLSSLIFRGAAGGSLPGLLKYGSPGEKAERALGGAVGGAAGGAAAFGLARLLRPLKNWNEVGEDAAKAADRLGYPLTAADRTGNQFLQNVENWMARMPGSSNSMQQVRRAQQSAINRAAAKAIGEGGDTLDERVMGSAQARIGQTLDEINSRADLDLTSDSFLQSLFRISDNNKALKSFASPGASKVIDDAFALADEGRLGGPEYARIRSALGKKAADATENEVKDAYKSIQSILDRAASESLSPEDAIALQAARRQYADFKALTRGQTIKGGDVSPKLVANALQAKYGDSFVTGRANSGLMDIGRIGRGIPSAVNPNSGSLMLTDKFMEAPISSSLVAGANRAASNVYLSPLMQRYLQTNMLPGGVEPALIRLGQSGGLLSIGTAQSYR